MSQAQKTQTDENIEMKEEKVSENSSKNSSKKIISDEMKRIEELEKQVNDLENKAQESEEKCLRAVADLQNVRRRGTDEKIKARTEGAITLLTPMIKVLDDFSRAFSHIPEELQKNEFIISLQKIEELFQKTLQENGVEFFAEKGDEFDAHFHESMMMDAETEDGKIAQVFEKGVQFKGSVVRHAKVTVGSKK